MGHPGLRQLCLCPSLRWETLCLILFYWGGCTEHRTDLAIFSNRLSHNLFLALPLSAPPPPFPQLPGANFWAFGILQYKEGYRSALSTASLGLAFLDPLIYLPLFQLLCSIQHFTAILFFPVLIIDLCFCTNIFTLTFTAFSSGTEYLFNQPSLMRISILFLMRKEAFSSK